MNLFKTILQSLIVVLLGIYPCRAIEPDVIIDEANSASVELIGSWTADASADTPFRGAAKVTVNSSANASEYARFHTSLPKSGPWEVSVWHAGRSGFAADVNVKITHANTLPTTATVSMGSNSGQWHRAGVFWFDASKEAEVRIEHNGTGFVSADAVKFSMAEAEELVDTQNPPVGAVTYVPGSSSWTSATDPSGYRQSVRRSNTANASISISTVLPAAGDYDVSLWLPARNGTWLPSGGTAAQSFVVEVYHRSGMTPLTVQFPAGVINEGGWVRLGTSPFRFNATPAAPETNPNKVVIKTNGSTGEYVPADAVRYTKVASFGVYQDELDPIGNPGVTFEGTGWGSTSETRSAQRWINARNINYGRASIRAQANPASVTYAPALPELGLYDAYVWYGYLTTNNHTTLVNVHSALGDTSLTIDQEQNAGKWFHVGRYIFDPADTTLTISTNENPTGNYSVADGVLFLRDNEEADSNGNGLLDWQETLLGVGNTEFDLDGDGYADGWDTDEDGMPNSFELQYGLNALDSSDADLDPDNDGLTNFQESVRNTNPGNPDSDGDGMKDGWEAEYGFDPLDPLDATEDPDEDGYSNLAEFNASTDPRDPNSFPGEELGLESSQAISGEELSAAETSSTVVSGSTGSGVIEDVPPLQGAKEGIRWKSINTKLLASYPSNAGSSLKRTASSPAPLRWNAGAVSDNYIVGDGYVEWRVANPGKQVCVGLASTNRNESRSFLHGFHFLADGTYQIEEKGRKPAKSQTGSFTAETTFRIERQGSTVRYYVYPVGGLIGSPIHKSITQTQGPLMVDTSFASQNAEIANCYYFRPAGPTDVLWIQEVNANPTYPSYLTKGGAGSTLTAVSAGNGFATSSNVVLLDGYVQFRIPKKDTVASVNLNSASASFGFKAAIDEKCDICKNGTPVSGVARVAYTKNDVFRVERSGAWIFYRKNDKILWQESATEGDLFVSANLTSSAAAVTNVQYSGASLVEPVTWVSLAPTTAAIRKPDGSQLKRTSGGGDWTAIATSGKAIYEHGWVNFRFGQSNKAAMAGLAFRTAGITATFSIRGRADGRVELVESGQIIATDYQYTAADNFTVRRIGSSVDYLINRNVMRSAVLDTMFMSTPPTSPIVEGSIFDADATIEDCTYLGVPDDVIWREGAGATASYSAGAGGTLTRGGSTAGFSAGAIGTQVLPINGSLKFSFGEANRRAMIGFTTADSDNKYLGLTSAVYGNSGTVNFFKKPDKAPTVPQSPTSYLAGDVFEMRRKADGPNATAVDVYKNGTIIKSFTGLPKEPFLVDTSLNSPSVSLKAQLWWRDSNANGLDDTWEIARFGKLVTSTDDDLDGVTNLEEFLGRKLDNNIPYIAFTSPAILTAPGGSVTLSATAFDLDGVIQKVEFYEGQTLLAADVTAPFSIEWSGATQGNHTLRVLACDNAGGISAASAVFTVRDIDGDGMDDEWEMLHFGNLAQTANGHFDGDGMTNLEEYRLGRNPAKGAVTDLNGAVRLKVYTPLIQ